MRAPLPSMSPWAPHSSNTLQAVELLNDAAGTFHGPSMSFGTPAESWMWIAASEVELGSSGHEDSAALPHLGKVALTESDSELTVMLSWASESIGLMWKPPPCPEYLKLDDWSLLVPHTDHQHPSPVPFFLDVHEEVTRLWRAPYSA